MVALYHITEIGSFIQIMQIIGFFFFCFQQSHLRESSKSIVIQPCLAYVAANTLEILIEGERPDAYFVPPATKFRYDIARQESGV